MRRAARYAHTYLVLCLLLVPSGARAMGLSLECKAEDGSFSLDKGTIVIPNLDGKEVQGSYFADSAARLIGYSLEEILQEAGPRFFIDFPHSVGNSGNEVVVTRKRNFRDPCGNRGRTTWFHEVVRVLDDKGRVLREGRIRCVETVTHGHCASLRAPAPRRTVA